VEYTVGSNTVDTVADTTAPTITLNGAESMTLNVGDTFSDPGATATDDVDGDLTSSVTTDAYVDTSVAGSYLVTYTVTDSSGNSATAERSVVVNDGNVETFILESRVASSEDDAEELADRNVYPASSDLELILDKTDQVVGVRFTNLSIPENATITKAYIQFQVDEASTDSAAFSIHGESTDNAPIFIATAGNISDRMKTNASVSWSPAAWDTVGEAGAAQRTADLAPIVQEIVSETGWSSGNAMAFIFTGSGKRVAEAYDGDAAGAPMLYVEYTVGSNTVDTVADTTAPTITLNGSAAMTLNVGDTFSDPGATATDDVDGDLTSSITTDAYVDTSVAGSYLVTYTVTDSSGNSATAERSVVVNNTTTVAPAPENPSGTTVVQARVASSDDDAE
jgi:hypothetical protein